jgi:hypothetical protein
MAKVRQSFPWQHPLGNHEDRDEKRRENSMYLRYRVNDVLWVSHKLDGVEEREHVPGVRLYQGRTSKILGKGNVLKQSQQDKGSLLYLQFPHKTAIDV